MSVAVLDGEGGVLWRGDRIAPLAAGAACFSLLGECAAETGLEPAAAGTFAADLGPGSFTGVRVGIVLAKSFGYLFGVDCVGASAFDLIDPAGTVVLPSKRGELFIRRPGMELERSSTPPSEPFRGYGVADREPKYPDAAAFSALLASLERVSPERLVPRYLIEPSISVPKTPFGSVGK